MKKLNLVSSNPLPIGMRVQSANKVGSVSSHEGTHAQLGVLHVVKFDDGTIGELWLNELNTVN